MNYKDCSDNKDNNMKERISNLSVGLIATEDINSPLLYDVDTNKVFMVNEQLKNIFYKPCHLYLLSEDPIKVGDYVFSVATNDVVSEKVFKVKDSVFVNATNYIYKIIATTDNRLNHILPNISTESISDSVNNFYMNIVCNFLGYVNVLTPSNSSELSADDWDSYFTEFMGSNEYYMYTSVFAWSLNEGKTQLQKYHTYETDCDGKLILHSSSVKYGKDEIIDKLCEYWAKTHGTDMVGSVLNKQMVAWLESNL